MLSENIPLLFKDFYSLTGIKICLYDAFGNELYYYPQKLSGFCSLVRQKNAKKCLECDKRAVEKCRETGKQYTYVCHAGLTECLSPITVENRIMGFIGIGQVKSAPAHFEDKSLQAEYDKLKNIPKDKLLSSIRILDACTGYEYFKSLIAHRQGSIDSRIKDYILSEISEQITLRDICSYFHISHNELYSLFREYFNMPPAEYIRTLRIDRACELLKTTELPVNRIGTMVGIPDYNYFSKVFKRQMGISPREFRKQNK